MPDQRKPLSKPMATPYDKRNQQPKQRKRRYFASQFGDNIAQFLVDLGCFVANISSNIWNFFSTLLKTILNATITIATTIKDFIYRVSIYIEKLILSALELIWQLFKLLLWYTPTFAGLIYWIVTDSLPALFVAVIWGAGITAIGIMYTPRKANKDL